MTIESNGSLYWFGFTTSAFAACEALVLTWDTGLEIDPSRRRCGLGRFLKTK